jgi:hypothetical protein
MESSGKFRIEHVGKAPAGWKVRTMTHPSGHEVRLAFPPGRRKKGSGRLIEIMHPHGENPEACNGPSRHSNPSELLIMGLGNPKGGTRHTGHGTRSKNPKTVTEEKAAAMQEKAIKALDNFDSDDPNGIRDMSVSEYAEHKHLKLSNPVDALEQKERLKLARLPEVKHPRHTKQRRNPDDSISEGKELYKAFHGKDAKQVSDLALKTEVQKTYVFGGELAGAKFLQDDGHFWEIRFRGDGVKMCANPEGDQLYCIGGNQDMLPILKARGVDISKDLIAMGRWFCVYYDAAKSVTNFKMTEWEHYFGCRDEIDKLLKQSKANSWSETEFQAHVKEAMDATPPLERDLPEAVFDNLNSRILFAGGSYYVNWPGIVG